ncbi:MAG: HlyC/CorC family transporter [Pyrinomonadaceae bacterium]|nr:HlyC/CorC family transporter [Acidobacteriota bacterium]MBP7476653.1 HlyC/CorC family transporter [Pyrinomonadaceae bacterium]MBP9109419.1 HlyC/CorC family transporter [Pyrinomonadaceae bacterium]
MEIEIIVAVGLLLLLGFLAAIDAAFSHISDVGLRRITSDDELGETTNSVKFLREILENRPRFRFALSSTIQILLICFTVLLTVIVGNFTFSLTRQIFFTLLIGLVATVLFRQILPRLLVRSDTERKLLFLLPAIRPIYAIASFFVEPITARRTKNKLNADTTATPDGSDDDDDNDEDFQALMEVGEAEGIIEEEERELIETIVEFGETLTSEIMTPRTGIIAVPAGTLIKDARDVMIEEKYSRLPIYRDSIDTVEGMVYVRDLLAALANGRKEEPVENIKRSAFFVPETKTASELLKSMQQHHVQIAVVIDEYGGVAGLVTVEDILEELVGEIEDEDTEHEEIIEIVEGDDGYFDVLGSTEIDKVERIFDIELEDEDYTTIAGLVTSEAGYVPKVGEKLELRGLAIEILQADEKRIQLLRLRKFVEDDETVEPSDH